MLKKKSVLAIGWMLIFIIMLSACSNSSNQVEENNKPTKSPAYTPQASEKPVTVTISATTSYISDADLNLLIIEPLKKNYPYITVERVTGSLTQLMNSGQIPDLVVTHNGDILGYSGDGFMSDLGELVKKHRVDMGRFSPEIVKSLTFEGKLMAIPYAVNFTALYYNKDIFNKFGVPYPKDGLTWDDAIELAKRVTRDENGIKYRGIDPETPSRLTRVMGIDSVDYKTNKATVDNDNWRMVFEIYKKAFSIPGNMTSTGEVTKGKGNKDFFEDMTLAMYPTVNKISYLMENAPKSGLNWDVAQYPSMPGKPGINTDVDAHLFGIPVNAKNKDAAMKVIEMITSEDVQMTMTRKTGRVSPLKDAKFAEAFAKDLPGTVGKNIAGIFKSKRIEAPIRSKYANQPFIDKELEAYVKGTQDLNTAIRNVEEAINKNILTISGK